MLPWKLATREIVDSIINREDGMRSVILLLMTFFLAAGVAQGSPAREFEQFARRFFADKAFQMNHIAFPVASVELGDWQEDNTVSLVHSTISRAKWKFISHRWGSSHHLETDSFYERVYDNFSLKPTRQLRDTGKRVVTFEGDGNGINVRFFFIFSQERWVLVRVEDMTT